MAHEELYIPRTGTRQGMIDGLGGRLVEVLEETWVEDSDPPLRAYRVLVSCTAEEMRGKLQSGFGRR